MVAREKRTSIVTLSRCKDDVEMLETQRIIPTHTADKRFLFLCNRNIITCMAWSAFWRQRFELSECFIT